MTDGYALIVRFALRPGAAAAFDALVADTVARIRTDEPGTVVYAVHTGAADPDLRIFYELYADEAAFAAHERQPHVRAFLAARAEFLAGPPEVTFAQAVAGSTKVAAVGWVDE